jgi:hypothetical protein
MSALQGGVIDYLPRSPTPNSSLGASSCDVTYHHGAKRKAWRLPDPRG